MEDGPKDPTPFSNLTAEPELSSTPLDQRPDSKLRSPTPDGDTMVLEMETVLEEEKEVLEDSEESVEAEVEPEEPVDEVETEAEEDFKSLHSCSSQNSCHIF